MEYCLDFAVQFWCIDSTLFSSTTTINIVYSIAAQGDRESISYWYFIRAIWIRYESVENNNDLHQSPNCRLLLSTAH